MYISLYPPSTLKYVQKCADDPGISVKEPLLPIGEYACIGRLQNQSHKYAVLRNLSILICRLNSPAPNCEAVDVLIGHFV